MKEIQQLLSELDDERIKFTKSDKDKMQRICQRLIELGHYPEKSGINLSAIKMVESYGVDWNTWREPLSCPECGADLCDRVNGAPFKREIGQYDMYRDMTVAYKCPDCQETIWESQF